MSFFSAFNQFCRRRGVVGAQVSVIAGNNYQLDSAYGFADAATKQPVKLDTIFRIASISKIVVAMSALQLIEKNKLSLKDDIGDILGFKIRNPHYPDKKITVKMLMTQTSSITDGYDDEDPAYDGLLCGYNAINGTTLPVSLQQLLCPDFGEYYTPLTWDKAVPGTNFIYSNFGCGILACIVEAVSGKYFTDYVRENIINPLGIDASFRADEIRNKKALASLYYPEKGGGYRLARSGESFVKAAYPRFPLKENYRGPAGGLFISMRDLSKIAYLLINDGIADGIRLLNKDTVDAMLQLHWYGQSRSYRAKGLQLKFMSFSGHTFKGHTGSAYGAISYLFTNREEKLSICFITNGGHYRRKRIMYDIQEDVFGAFIKHYWPNHESKHRFTADLNADYGCLDDRIIKFKAKPQIKCDNVFLAVADIADIFNIVPVVTDNKIILKKHNRQIVVADKMLSVQAVCAKFKSKYRFANNHLEIIY